ncbi:MAG: hypothetical protein IJM37_00540 [Lachnospiraceae bacterium]|nr:hypothetical protein [Lachnospiraceae bacterium]
MGNRLSIKSVFSIAGAEYIKWITNPRIIIVGVLFLVMRTLAVEPLLERAEKMGERLSILEPFAAIGNSGMLVLLMPCVFLILVSDYPVITGNTLFVVLRTGKQNWFFGQLLFMLYAVFSFIGSVFLASVVMSRGSAALSWSEVVRMYEARFPNEIGNYASRLLPSNLYNQIPLVKAVTQTAVLLAAYLFLLVLVLYFFKLLHLRGAGIFAVFVIIGMGMASVSVSSPVKWVLPMANTIIWLHYTEIMSEPVYPVKYSFFYFVAAIIILLAANYIALRKIQFINIQETE